MNCIDMTKEQRLSRMADAIWKGQEWRGKGVAGVCKFCGCELPYVYHVTKGGEVHDVKRGTKAEARAVEVLNATGPQEAMVLPATICEAMCEPGLHMEAQAEVRKRRERWRATQESKDEPAKPDIEGMGGSWS